MSRPLVTREQAISLANEIFGLRVDSRRAKCAKELDSYDDRNFYLYGTKDGQDGEFLLKVYNRCFEGRELVNAVHQIMFLLRDSGVVCPVPQKTVKGDYVETRHYPLTPRKHAGKKPKTEYDLFPCTVNLFSFVPGKTVKDYQEHGHSFKSEMYYKVGQLTADIVNALKDFKCPPLEEREHQWDLYYFDATLTGVGLLAVGDKKLVKKVSNEFKNIVKPRFDVLLKQCIHGDINDANIVVQKIPNSDDFEVTGIIDFGDVNYSVRIFDIAIAAAYMMTVAENDAIRAGANTIAGFHDKSPLTEDESEVIFCCIKARLCQSVCFGTHSSMAYPENAKYLLYNATKALKVIEAIVGITKEDFDKVWRELCKK